MTRRKMLHYLKYVALVIIGVIIGFFAKGKFGSNGAMPGMGGQATVLVQTLKKEPMLQGKKFIARVEAINAADVVPQVSGYIDKVMFKDGSLVKEGDVLFVIDQKRYKAAVSSAQAAVDKAKANLTQVENDFHREQELYRDQMLSKADMELAESNLANAKANVKSAQAALDLAKLDLNYTEVRSPITGYVGKALITKGNLATAGASKLARVIQMDPIRVVFSITDKERLSGMDELTIQHPDLQIALPNGDTINMPSATVFSDNEINAQTATMAVYAKTDNPDNRLVPGNYVNVTVSLDKLHPVLSVPQTAVSQDATGQYVMTVTPDNTVVQKYITTGDMVNGKYIVVSGLEEGDRVVTMGQQRLQNGMKVNVSEMTAPDRTTPQDNAQEKTEENN